MTKKSSIHSDAAEAANSYQDVAQLPIMPHNQTPIPHSLVETYRTTIHHLALLALPEAQAVHEKQAYHMCEVLEDRKVHLVHQVGPAKEDCKEKKDHLEEMDREVCQDLKDLLDHGVQQEARCMALPEQWGYDSKKN
jgi:hypothetical protein